MTMQRIVQGDGWGKPEGDTWWHYFRNGRSLCGKWDIEDDSWVFPGQDDHPNNCPDCRALPRR